jgi:hypothetical protein
VLFAVSMPAGNERGPLYMEQALAAIRIANPGRLPISLLFARHQSQAKLLCRVPDELASVVTSQLYAHYPDCRLEPLAEDALDASPDHRVWTTSLHLFPELFPIKRYGQFEDALNRVSADPITAILTAVAAVRVDQMKPIVEIVLRPARASRRRRAHKCLHRLGSPLFRRHERLAHLYLHLALSPSPARRLIAFPISRFASPHAEPRDEFALHTSSGRLHERETDLLAGADKLGRQLFEAEICLRVTAPESNAKRAERLLRQMAGAFGLFHAPGLASFHAGATERGEEVRSKRSGFLLSVEELATLWHPPTVTVKAPTMATVETREMEPPATLPLTRSCPGLPALGMTSFRGRRERFGILQDDRRRHVLIEGKTGMGKTTLLHHLIATDIAAGQGVGLIDPHGDLADAVLREIPPARTNDVVLFDVGDTDYPLAFNPLSCADPRQRPLVASGVLSSFKKLYGDSWGPRLEHILRNALLTLLEVPGTSLVSVLRILSDPVYRRWVLVRVSDPVLRAFWEHEFAALPAKFQAEAIAPIQNKVGAYVSSPFLRNILGQAGGTLDLRRVMDDGKILIVNLSKGRIGDDASMLLGSLLVTNLQLAAMSRADVPETKRRDFSLYVDEFQNFATDSFATILSEARKYRLSLTLANQYLQQMDEQTLAAVWGNIGSLIVFQVGAQDSEILAEQLGGDLQKSDLLQLPRYQAYVRLLIEGQPSRPFSMRTLPPPSAARDFDRLHIVRRTSRQRYARPVARVEAEIAAAFAR